MSTCGRPADKAERQQQSGSGMHAGTRGAAAHAAQ